MMEQKERRRSTGKVDRLPPELKDTVEQMLLTGCTYKEIVAFSEGQLLDDIQKQREIGKRQFRLMKRPFQVLCKR